MTSNKTFLSTPQAAHHLGYSSSTLEHWRSAGKGPDFVRMSPRKIYYRISDLDNWIESRVIAPGASTRASAF